tara:strand:- start:5 stop:196 length:192 start_codon:yes stop_codon:yes gene_type:complete
MSGLLNFAKERAGSLVSKKLAAAAVAEFGAAGTPMQGTPLLVYIVVQGLSEAFQHWCDAQASK